MAGAPHILCMRVKFTRFARLWVLFTGLALLVPAQAPKPAPARAPGNTPAATPSTDVDNIIELVKSGMSEALLIKTIQRQGQAYNLGPADMVKLQKAGVSEKIIETMLDPSSGGNSAALPAADAEPAAKPAAAPPPAAPGPPAAASASQAAPPSSAPAKKKGFFSSIGDSFGKAAKDTADSTKKTVDKTVEDTSTNANKRVQDSVAKAEVNVDCTAGKASRTAGQKTGGKDSTTPAANNQIPQTGCAEPTNTASKQGAPGSAQGATTPAGKGTGPAVAPAPANNPAPAAAPALARTATPQANSGGGSAAPPQAAAASNPAVQFRQRYALDLRQAATARNTATQYERRLTAQGLQLPPDLGTALDRLNNQLKATLVAMNQNDTAQAERSLQDLEATTAAVQRSVPASQSPAR